MGRAFRVRPSFFDGRERRSRKETKMADDRKGAYGTVHVMEDAMREAEQGVFEAHAGEAGKKRRAKKEPSPSNKMAAEPSNKAAAPKKAVDGR
jgi:hypothetical protein